MALDLTLLGLSNMPLYSVTGIKKIETLYTAHCCKKLQKLLVCERVQGNLQDDSPLYSPDGDWARPH